MKPCYPEEMRALFLLLSALFLILPTQTHAAEDSFAVLELFTTRACSDSPPVDARIKKIVDEADSKLIALGCHISYLNRPPQKESERLFGPKLPTFNDPLAQKLCDKRQSAYRKAKAFQGMGAPQIMLNGRFSTIGAAEKTITSGIKMVRQHAPLQSIELHFTHNALDITLPEMKFDKPVQVWLFGYNKLHREIGASGLETNEMIDYVNYVTHLENLFDWDGSHKNISIPLTDMQAEGYAVIAQYQDFTGILAAGKIERN